MRSRIAKRLLDVVGASAILLAGLPILIVTALLVRWKLGSPVFFRQLRPGHRGKLFTLYKFRTMRNDTDAEGNPLPDDQRLTRLGRFLRGTSLDELPELWNVLRGDMSLVGPRPLLIEHLPIYTPEQARRHEVKPGITGWAQVHGRDALPWEDKMRLDVWYVDHGSLWLDVRILLRTLAAVFSREGVIHPEAGSMDQLLRSRGGVVVGRSFGWTRPDEAQDRAA